MNIKKMVGIIVLLILAGGGFFLAQRASFFDENFSYAGTLEATRIIVPTRLSSQITKFDVKAGDRLTKGQVIAKLDDSELKISFKKLNSRYERGLTLFKDGHFPKSDLEVLEAEKDDIELKLSWCSVKSPINGVVLAKYKEAGEWVTQGTGIVAIADTRNLWTIFYVEHDKIASLKLGMQVACVLPEMPGKKFRGQISVINSEPEFTPKNVQTRSERTRLVFGVRVDFENKEEILKPGMTIETQFSSPE
ncbi:MAG: efflux RND transporter periplasmic adaptor subunit [Holosporales bacterium]|jgi:HlyD family secretion protein|nr:efflux RND transporter periplasmic adaptor subunit [Holosporales bacterium]